MTNRDARKGSAERRKLPDTGRGGSPPIPWDALPHQKLWIAALDAMSLGSRERAAESSRLHVLRRRLPRLDPADHMDYVALVGARIVERLRAVRDQYREHLRARGAEPLVEMYAVVVRLGVKDWAVMALREAILDYVVDSQIKTKEWNPLYGPLSMDYGPLSTDPHVKTIDKEPCATVQRNTLLVERLALLLKTDVFDLDMTGGPFGREGQVLLGRSRAGQAILEGKSPWESIRERQEMWDRCYPWTEGLAMLFDAAKGEIVFQFNALGDDGRQAESEFLQLSDFQRIAYKHLRAMRSINDGPRKLSALEWGALFRDLDDSGLRLDNELLGTARNVLMAVRQKGVRVDKWVQCFDSPARVVIGSGSPRTLKREVMHAVHNAAKVATYQLEKVWRLKR